MALTLDTPLLRRALRAGFAVRYGILPSQWGGFAVLIGYPADQSNRGFESKSNSQSLRQHEKVWEFAGEGGIRTHGAL